MAFLRTDQVLNWYHVLFLLFKPLGLLGPFSSGVPRARLVSVGLAPLDQLLHPALGTACEWCFEGDEVLFHTPILCFLSSWKAFSTGDNFRFGTAAEAVPSPLAFTGWINSVCNPKAKVHLGFSHFSYTLFFFFLAALAPSVPFYLIVFSSSFQSVWIGNKALIRVLVNFLSCNYRSHFSDNWPQQLYVYLLIT